MVLDLQTHRRLHSWSRCGGPLGWRNQRGERAQQRAQRTNGTPETGRCQRHQAYANNTPNRTWFPDAEGPFRVSSAWERIARPQSPTGHEAEPQLSLQECSARWEHQGAVGRSDPSTGRPGQGPQPRKASLAPPVKWGQLQHLPQRAVLRTK